MARRAVAGTIGALLLMQAACQALAQATPPVGPDPAPITLPDTVITGTRTFAGSAVLAGSTTVVDRQWIEDRKPQSMLDLLRRVPGLHTDQPAGRGGVASVYLRGGDPNHTVVLIDGVRVNDSMNSRGGSFDLSTLDVSNVVRVEVLRGPFSSVYGSAAMAGVINIVTRDRSREPRTTLSIAGNSVAGRRLTVGVSAPIGDLGFGMSASVLNEGKPVEGGRHEAGTVSGWLSGGSDAGFAWSVGGRFSAVERQSFPDDSGGPLYATLRDVDRRRSDEAVIDADGTYRWSDALTSRLHLSHFRRGESITSPGVAPGVRDPFGIPPNSDRSTFNRTAISLGMIARPVDGARLGFGVEWQREAGQSRGLLDFGAFTVPTAFDLNRDTWSPYVEGQYETPFGLTVEFGLRLDKMTGQSAAISPRVGLSYALRELDTVVHAAWGRGFKAPSFYALGNPIVGNPSLRPERSESVEVGVRQSLFDRRLVVGATFFRGWYRDIIDFDAGPPPLLVNRSQLDTRGIELSLEWQVMPTLDVVGHLTYLDARTTPAATLRHRPKWRAGGSIVWRPTPELSAAFDVLHVSRFADSSIATGDRQLPGHQRLDLTVAWQPLKQARLTAGVQNLLNRRYEEVVGFPDAGLLVRGALDLKF